MAAMAAIGISDSRTAAKTSEVETRLRSFSSSFTAFISSYSLLARFLSTRLDRDSARGFFQTSSLSASLLAVRRSPRLAVSSTSSPARPCESHLCLPSSSTLSSFPFLLLALGISRYRRLDAFTIPRLYMPRAINYEAAALPAAVGGPPSTFHRALPDRREAIRGRSTATWRFFFRPR